MTCRLALALLLAGCGRDPSVGGSTTDDVAASTTDDGWVSTSTSGATGPQRAPTVWGTGYEDDGGATSCSFNCGPDPSAGGGGGGGWPCSVTEQDCWEARPKCVAMGYSTWNTRRCANEPRVPRGLGEACVVTGGLLSGEDDCAIGLQCLGDFHPRAFEAAGRCVELCGTCTDPADACVPLFGGALPICTRLCDPLAPEPCADGWPCLKTNDEPPAVFACTPSAVDTHAETFEACAIEDHCGPAHHCADLGAPLGECRKLCAVQGHGPQCDLGSQCVPLPSFPGSPWAHVGECVAAFEPGK